MRNKKALQRLNITNKQVVQTTQIKNSREWLTMNIKQNIKRIMNEINNKKRKFNLNQWKTAVSNQWKIVT